VSGREDIALVYKTTGSYSAGDRRSLSGPTLVAVVKSSDLRNYYDAPAFWLFHSRLRSVLGQRQMSSGALVQVDNLIPIVLNWERSVIRGIRGMGVRSGFMERL
jgi:hypothetical protein